MNYSKFLLVIIISIGFLSLIESSVYKGKRSCYSCQTEESGLDCIYNPENLTIVPCRFYCTTTRREYVDFEGSTIFLHRACEKTPEFLDQIVIEKYFITYYRSCRAKPTEEPCNSGIGVDSFYKYRNGSLEDEWLSEWDENRGASFLQRFEYSSIFFLLLLTYLIHEAF